MFYKNIQVCDVYGGGSITSSIWFTGGGLSTSRAGGCLGQEALSVVVPSAKYKNSDKKRRPSAFETMISYYKQDI